MYNIYRGRAGLGPSGLLESPRTTVFGVTTGNVSGLQNDGGKYEKIDKVQTKKSVGVQTKV